MPGKSDRKTKEGLAEELLTGAGIAGAETGPQARPGFREASFYRIQKRLDEEAAGGARRHGARREERRDMNLPHRMRWAVLVPAATLMLMMLFTTGAFAFSLNAEPDSSLYGTKLFFESTRLSLTGSTEAKVDYEMKLVEKRLGELEGMIARGAQQGGPHWQDAYRNNVDRLYEEMMKLPDEQREEMLEYASAVLEGQARTMATLQAEAPEDLAPCIEGARVCGMGAIQGMRGQCRQQGTNDTADDGNGSVDNGDGNGSAGEGGGNDGNAGEGGGNGGSAGEGGGNGGGNDAGKNYCPGRS